MKPQRKASAMLRVFRRGEKVLFDLKSRKTCKLNDVAAKIWVLCDGSHSLNDIVGIIAKEYDADRKTIENDLKAFIEKLLSLDLVEM